MKKILIFVMLFFNPLCASKMCPLDQECELLFQYRILLIKMGMKKVYQSVDEAEMEYVQKQKIVDSLRDLEVYMGFTEFIN